MKKFIVLLFMLIAVTGCEYFMETWSPAFIENHSDKTIWACGVLPGRRYGSWTAVPNDGKEVEFFVTSGSFKRILSDERHLVVYITDEEPKENINSSMAESEIMQKFNIIQKYELTRDDWWNVGVMTYPPTEKMAGVPMWPPYEKSVEQDESK